jgi:parallel beta-helix repeat protein
MAGAILNGGKRVRRFVVLFGVSLFCVFSTKAAKADNCEVIRAAIKALPAYGGEVQIAPGGYTCDSPIVLDRDNITLNGNRKVMLTLANNANSPVVIMGDVATPPRKVTNVQLLNISIDGNYEHQQYECWNGECDTGGTTAIRNNGVTVRGIADGVIKNVYIRGARSGGVVTEKGCKNLKVDGLVSVSNYFDGFAGYETYGADLNNMVLSYNRAAGISLDIRFDGNVIRNSLLQGNYDVGIFMRDSSANVFTNVDVISSGNHGVFLAFVKDESTCPLNNEFNDLLIAGSKGAGFRMNNVCAGNKFTGQARFLQNAGGCLSKGDGADIDILGEMECK